MDPNCIVCPVLATIEKPPAPRPIISTKSPGLKIAGKATCTGVAERFVIYPLLGAALTETAVMIVHVDPDAATEILIVPGPFVIVTSPLPVIFAGTGSPPVEPI